MYIYLLSICCTYVYIYNTQSTNTCNCLPTNHVYQRCLSNNKPFSRKNSFTFKFLASPLKVSGGTLSLA